jgi:phosphonate transport system substrate-binding protein
MGSGYLVTDRDGLTLNARRTDDVLTTESLLVEVWQFRRQGESLMLSGPAGTVELTRASGTVSATQTLVDAPDVVTSASEAPLSSASPPTSTETTATTVVLDVGTAANPIRLVFVPSVNAQTIVNGGSILESALERATGLEFQVERPNSHRATVEVLCEGPDNTIGFIPGLGYALASELCGADVAFKAVRFGYSVFWSQILVRRGSPFDSLQDLAGLRWATTDRNSTSGYMVPLLMLEEANVAPADIVEVGGHPDAVLALYNGQVDFASTFYSPPLVGGGWQVGDPPDVPDGLVSSCRATADGLWCGNYRVLDARASVRDQAPDVIQQVRILAISRGIPNDAITFGSSFPAPLRVRIEEAIYDFSLGDGWSASVGSNNFYGWSGIEPATDAEYADLRSIVSLVGLTLADL